MDFKSCVIKHEDDIKKESEILVDEEFFKEGHSVNSDSLVKDRPSIKENHKYERIEVYVKEEFEEDLSEYLDVTIKTPLKPEENQGDSGLAGNSTERRKSDWKHYNKDLSDKEFLNGQEKKFKCNHCDGSFKRMFHLRRHLRIHTGDKPFKCDYCDKRFNVMSDLKRHLRIHTGDKPFKCDHCDKSFNVMSTLKTHLRIYSGEKPFKCDQCNRSFSQKSDLKTHLRTHTGEKPFKCDHCNKSFSQSGTLKRHLMIHATK